MGRSSTGEARAAQLLDSMHSLSTPPEPPEPPVPLAPPVQKNVDDCMHYRLHASHASHRSMPRSAKLVAAFVLSVTVASCFGVAWAGDQTLHLVGQDPFDADIVQLDETSLVIRRDDGKEQDESIPWQRVVSWGCRRDPRPLPQWLFRDGGIMVANVLQANQQSWRGGNDLLAFASTTAIWDEVRAPATGLAGVILQPPRTAHARDAWERQLRQSAGVADQLWLVGGNSVQGEFLRAGMDNEEAVAESWNFLARSRNLRLPSQRVTGLRLGRDGATVEAAARPRLWLGFQDGSHVAVRRWTSRAGIMRLELASGGNAAILQEAFYEQLCFVRPHREDVLYLADAEPSEQRHRPFLTVRRPLRRGATVLGGLPRVSGRVFGKTLGVASESFVVYDLAALESETEGEAEQPLQGWRRLVTAVALDDSAGPLGSVEFEVFVRRGEDWAPAASAGLVRSGDAPRTLQVDLRGASQIALVVGFGERGDTDDVANWLEPRLER